MGKYKKDEEVKERKTGVKEGAKDGRERMVKREGDRGREGRRQKEN